MKQNKNTFPRIRRLFIYLVEKYCPFNIKTFQVWVAIVTTILLGIILVLGWISSKKVKEIVTQDFNQQQLVLAQHAARQIENELNNFKRELSLLSLAPSIQYFEKNSIGKSMGITFSSIMEDGVLEIRYIESKDRVHLMDSNGYQTIHTYPECLRFLEWASQLSNKGKILITEVSPIIYGSNYQTLIAKMALPVWQVSVDDANPVAANKFSGVLVFVLDVTRLIERITKDIKSGKTGYAWVMDDKGVFMYHPEKEFIGKNAFEARKEKKPSISFARINEIQKEMMLTGKEGTSWYISGWHKGNEGEMKKLIAYTPIHFNSSDQLWAVAVVAPASEIEEAIHSIQIRQFSLQATIIVVILLGGLTIIFLLFNWSSAMEQEVDRKTIELKKSEQRYKSLVENAEDLIFVVDQNGNYLSINKYGAQFMNKKPEEIVGHNMSEIIPWPGAKIPLQMIKEVFDAKETRQATHSLRIGEHDYWLNTNFRRLWDASGNIYAVLGISRDVTLTKKREQEEQMYHTEKLASMGTLAAGVAHEINNPLALILGFTDLLLERAVPDSPEQDMLKTIEKHGLHAKSVVENLLSFARYTEHKDEFVNINQIIEKVLLVVGNTLVLNRISFEQKLEPDLPKIKGDGQEIGQIFLNIINNAMHAMKGGGTLIITTRLLDNEWVEIRFSDTGHGIKKDNRTRIFDPLFTTKKVGEGTGLGLSVSYGMVTKHGGTITFETKTKEESDETGTTFIITLPVVKTDQQSSGATDQ